MLFSGACCFRSCLFEANQNGLLKLLLRKDEIVVSTNGRLNPKLRGARRLLLLLNLDGRFGRNGRAVFASES